MTSDVFTQFILPNGTVLKNRIAKAAMEENMANADLLPSDELIRLYETWAKGGAGLLITGNVMIDKLAMTGPADVALEQDTDLTRFKAWTSAIRKHGSRVLAQISHPGRQVYKNMGGKVIAPSAIALDLGSFSSLFDTPSEMTEADIKDVIARFTQTAKQAEAAGFDGVEIHGAHGYLIAQFLSPLSNRRKDDWGGSLENRTRLLLEVVKSIRNQVNPGFIVAVKLNSADFQRGGFDIDDAKKVVNLLEPLGVDLVELSGGSYEAPAMQGSSSDDRTLAREAYFLTFAEDIRQATNLPLMVTGGIRRLAVAEQVIDHGLDLVGMATALAMEPALPNLWQENKHLEAAHPDVGWKNKALKGLAVMAMVRRQLRRIGDGKKPLESMSPYLTLPLDQLRIAKLTRSYRKLINEQSRLESS